MKVPRRLRRFVPRTRKTVILAVLAVLTVGVGTAFAAFFLTGGSGSGSATLGSPGTGGQLQISLSFANGLTPGNSEPVKATFTNPTSSTYVVNSITAGSVTTSDPSCLPSWFTWTTDSAFGPMTIPAGVTSSPAQVGTISFNDDGQPDQNPCAGATITLSATSN